MVAKLWLASCMRLLYRSSVAGKDINLFVELHVGSKEYMCKVMWLVSCGLCAKGHMWLVWAENLATPDKRL